MMRIVLCDSAVVNSYGFRTEVEGIDLSRFGKNPVMLFNHDPERVIGRWENWDIEDGRLTAVPEFDLEDPFATEIARKVENGFIKGCSMGLMIKTMETRNGVDVATSSVLLEASIVSIPADENALVVYEDEDRKKQLSINEFKTLYCDMKEEEIKAGEPPAHQEKAGEPNEHQEKAGEPPALQELQAQVEERDAKIAELTATVNALKNQLAEFEYREAEAFVDAAIAEGKIGEDVRSEALSFYLSFPKETEKLIGSIAGKAGAGSMVNAGEPPALQQVSLAEMVKKGGADGTSGKSWDDLDRQPGALKALQLSNPEEFKRLYKEKFGVEWTF
jgi:HK97 family phage prohead protease